MPGIAEGKRIQSASPPVLTGPLSLFGFRSRIYTSATVTLTADDLGAMIFTTGATTAQTFTLPPPCGGNGVAPFIWFVNTADNVITVATATADTLIALNDAQADSVATSTVNARLGAFLLAVCDGTNWVINGFVDGSGTNGGIVITS